MDFSGAFAPPKKVKPASLFEWAAPSFDDSTDLENTHTTGESPTNAAYLPPGSQPTSVPTGKSPYSPPSAGVLGPDLGQQKRPDLNKDIYAPQLNDVTEKLNAAYQAPHAGTLRQVLGGILTGMNPRNPIGGLVSGETQRQRAIEPLQDRFKLLSGAIKENQGQELQQAQIGNYQSEAELRKHQAANFDSEVQARLNPKATLGTAEEQAINDIIKRGEINPDTKKPYTFAEAYEREKQVTRSEGKGPNTAELLKQQIDAANAKGDTATVKQLQKRLKDVDPLGENRLAVTIQGQQNTQNRAEENISRKDVATHDKAYVQPAEQVEKSYQMMQHAYDEYKQAKAQGKSLPTGAQSMLALSTHLSTTFGNVKGSRVTKDMIEHHLGARSISDSALVAFQKLTNGDALSPGQWDAFHDLIGQSRKLSWQTAVKEAGRKKIPVDFLPKDLSGISGDTTEGTSQGTSPANGPPSNLLKEGVHTTFKNGQTWTLRNGQVTQVQ